MPIVRDGEKFACKQCIQGHRVSGCNHIDRPLQHVNKKGRPVSQCPHCRGLRRSRQTHIKCDCGERRHSRNNSSESASTSLDEDSSKCKCSQGKKCVCGLKSEASEGDLAQGFDNSPSPQSQRSSPMRWMPPRRSEGSIPRFRNTYQPQALRSASNFSAHGYGPLGGGQTHRPYQLGLTHLGAQRSVDSLPLSSSSTMAAYQSPMRNPSYDHSFLNPDYGMQQQFHVPQTSGVALSEHLPNDFPIHLDQTTIDRTLSPHNNKRYSMNDFSMMAGMSQEFPEPRLFPGSSGSEAQPFAFQQEFSSHDFAFPQYAATSAQNPPPQSATSGDYGFPSLSRSSSGGTSDPGDAMFLNPAANSSQPLITIDPTWGFATSYAGSEKSNFDFTPTSLQETTPSEYASPFDEASLPSYDLDSGSNGLNPFSTEPPSGGINDFPLPGHDFNQGEARNDMTHRGLPDRSTVSLQSSPQAALDMDFRFPSHDLASSDAYAGSPLRQGWSPMAESTGVGAGSEGIY